MYRERILDAQLGLPNYQNFIPVIGEELTALADKLFKALWYAYLRDKGSINLTYWADRFNDATALNSEIVFNGGDFDSSSYDFLDYDTINANSEDYRTIYINKYGRWLQVQIDCESGSFGFKGMKLIGNTISNKE